MDDPITKIKYIGNDIGAHLDELLSTGRIIHLEELEKSPRLATMRLLTKIAGVGPRIAERWVQMGVKTLADLRRLLATGKINLTNMQSLGLRYYDDLNSRIPRAEVAAIVGLIFPVIGAPKMECVGSYRRGLADSGDVDIIISGGRLDSIMERISGLPCFLGTLSLGSERTTFLMSAASGRARQVDILNLDLAEYYFGILYFTGSWEFNEAMRGHAKKLGLRLNQHGLTDLKTGKSIRCDSEECIFKALGLRYVEPRLRIDRDSLKN